MRVELIIRAPGVGLATRVFQAADAEAARQQARAAGLEVVDLVSAGGSGQRARPATPAAFDHGHFAEELGTLLQAGLGMMEAVEALSCGEQRAARRAVLERIRRELQEGRSLSDALAATQQVPLLLVANVRASERTGHLVDALLRHAQYSRQAQALRASLVGAATYPALLLGVGCLVVLFLLGYVIPRFAVLVQGSKGELPWASQLLMSLGAALADRPWLPVAALAGLVLAGLLAWRRLRGGRGRAWLGRLPGLGRLLREYRIAQAYRTAGLLVRGGLPVVQALEQCEALLDSPDREGLAAATRQMREGVALSAALGAAQLADPITARMLVVAERTGTLPDVLERIAVMQDARLQRAVHTASRLAEPLLMIGIGLVIGAIVVLMYLPIFDLAAQVQ
jgi:general secretion pathway protein F